MLLLQRAPLRRRVHGGGASSEQPAYPLHAPPGPQLLVGDLTTSYAVADQTAAGKEEAYGFVAQRTGTVHELRHWTGGTASPGITGLDLGILADNAGLPGAVLGRGLFSGEPPPSAFAVVSGLSIPVVAGVKYWLVHLPLGALYHFPVANLAGPNVEGKVGARSKIEGQAEWDTFNEGPIGFAGIGE